MNRRVGVVIQREFWTTVRRPSYLISTLGMPLFIVLISAVSSIPALVVAKKELRPQTVGIVDRSGLLGLKEETTFSVPPPAMAEEVARSVAPRKGTDAFKSAFADATKIGIRPYATLEALQDAVRRSEITSALEFPEDYLATGKVRSYEREGFLASNGTGAGRELVKRFLVEKMLAGRLPPDILERVRRPINARESFTLGKDGVFRPTDIAGQIVSFVIPLVFTVLFFISVVMSSGFLLQGVSEEKENRVIEVILSSIDSDDLMLGKLIGLGGAGLLQIAVWMGLVVIIQLAAGLALASSGIHLGVGVHAGAIAWSIVFYLLGYFMFGVLLTGTGSLGQNLKESQQYGMMWVMGSVVPLASMVLLLSEPNGTYARTLSFIPLTAPVTMFLRLHSIEPPPWWETLLSAMLLALAAWAALKLMSKIFRVGLLLYGKRPTIPEIVRVLRRPRA